MPKKSSRSAAEAKLAELKESGFKFEINENLTLEAQLLDGVKFRLDEFDGQEFYVSDARAYPRLSCQQMGDIIAAAHLPLRGLEDLQDAETIADWIEKEGVGDDCYPVELRDVRIDIVPFRITLKSPEQQITAAEVYEDLRNANEEFNNASDCLGNQMFADKKVQNKLRKIEKLCEQVFDELGSEEVEITATKPEFYKEILFVRYFCAKWSDRFGFLADVSEQRQKTPQTTDRPNTLNRVIKHLSDSFERLFGRKAGAKWTPLSVEKDTDNPNAPEEADGPFIRFAEAFFDAMDHPVKRSAIKDGLYAGRKAQKSS